MDCATTAYRQGGLHLRQAGRPGALRLELWPSRVYALPVALFTLLWLRFLWRWYGLVIVAADGARGFLFLFGLPFLLAGMSLIATSVRLVLGRTVLELDALCLRVSESATLGRRPPRLVLATSGIRTFVAECSASLPEEDRDLDAWHVRAVLDGDRACTLPLPVRTMAEAELVARRLTKALGDVRAPDGYRG